MVDGLKCKIHHVTDCGVLMLEDLGQTGYFHIRHSDFVSPIRKSLREEINDIAKQWLLTEDHYDLAECVIDIIKQRKDEL